MKGEGLWKRVVAWCLYDFANSSYSAVIASAIFPVYFTTHIVGNERGEGDLWWGRAISISMLFVLVTSPFMGHLADKKGLKRRFLILYTLACVISVALMAVLRKGDALLGFVLIVIANAGMEGALVFYNAFMPDLVSKEFYGRVSAWGFGIGYVGSIVSLLIALYLVGRNMYPMIWLAVALFFLIFAMPSFFFMPSTRADFLTCNSKDTLNMLTFKTLIGEILKNKNTRRFLVSYLLYEDGINTVIIFASIFAATSLGFQYNELIALYLLVQTTAFLGSFFVAKRLDTSGPKQVLVAMLVLWILVTFFCTWIESKGIFWSISCLAGLGLGSIQAASRAMFLSLVPSKKEGLYFGIYSLAGKSSAVIGPFLFGEVSHLFGSQRPAVFMVFLIFVLGLWVLWPVRGR